MHDDDEFTVCDQETDEMTEFDPTPWGARQRMIPSRTFVRAAQAAACPEPAPPVRPAILLPPPATLITFAPAAPVSIAIPLPSIRTAWLPKLGAMLRPYAMPLCGAAAVILFTIAYVAKPTTHDASPLGTSLTMHSTPAVLAIAAPAPAAPTIVATPIEPAPIVEPKLVAELAPRIATVAKPVMHHRPATAHQSKSTSARGARPRLAALDAADLSSPLGHLRPR